MEECMGWIRSRGKLAIGVVAPVLVAGVLLVPGPSPAGADVTQVGGGAFGTQVGVTLLALPAVSVGPTPSVVVPNTGGGPISDSLATINLPGVLTTGVLNVSTQGANLGTHAGIAQSSAQVAGVAALTNALTADLVSSSCISNGDGSSATTTLANANVLGTGVISANPAPNTVINVANVASITFNEQVTSNVPGVETSVTVNAVHVRLDAAVGNGDIILAQSRCLASGPDVLIAPPTTPPTSPPEAVVLVPRFTG
jgi:hypothetical protein